MNTDWNKVSVRPNQKVVGPTSCLDLWRMNQTEPGFQSSDGTKMKSVYCDVSGKLLLKNKFCILKCF